MTRAPYPVTTIASNGGGRIYPIEALFERLNTDTLDRMFEAFGDFIMPAPVNMRGELMTGPDGVLFFGNFATYSHVFNVLTDDADLIERLSAAILANKKRPEYLAQPPYFDGRKFAIKEHRRSTTQGEVELIYDGESIGRFGDQIELNGRGQWVGRSPQFWTDTARRFMAELHTAKLAKEAKAESRKFDRLNIEPDDNYRVYYRDTESRRLYCWLCYGRSEVWAFYVCTRDGEPSHEVPPPEGLTKPAADHA